MDTSMGTSEQAGGKFRDGKECAGWDMAVEEVTCEPLSGGAFPVLTGI